jgi:hypothetical protein
MSDPLPVRVTLFVDSFGVFGRVLDGELTDAIIYLPWRIITAEWFIPD